MNIHLIFFGNNGNKFLFISFNSLDIHLSRFFKNFVKTDINEMLLVKNTIEINLK